MQRHVAVRVRAYVASEKIFGRILFYAGASVKLDGWRKICYIFAEVIDMAKLSGSMADKLKNMARGLKEEESSTGVKHVADKIKSQTQGQKKISADDGKASGRKN